MSVARTHHTKDYTCMSNYHFKDKKLSLKAKGLLSLMLSLPDTWDYSIAGLASLSSDGETSVRTAIKELEDCGYLTRTQIRENGKIVDWEYDIYEKPSDLPLVENPLLENKDNKVSKQSSTKEVNTVLSKDNTTDFQFGAKKQSKGNLYTKCIALVDNYTSNEDLRNALIDYLRVRLEMRDVPLYTNSWKGLLNKLDRDFDASERLAVVRQSIERGYKSFFPVNRGKYLNKDKFTEQTVISESYTAKELEELARLDEERERNGQRTKF